MHDKVRRANAHRVAAQREAKLKEEAAEDLAALSAAGDDDEDDDEDDDDEDVEAEGELERKNKNTTGQNPYALDEHRHPK